MLYEVCYRALLSISVVEATDGVACGPSVGGRACTPALAGLDLNIKHFQISPPGQLSGGPTR